MSSRHTRQRAGVVTVERNGALRKSIEIWGFELVSPVRADHVSIQTIEKYDNDVLRSLAFYHKVTLGHRLNRALTPSATSFGAQLAINTLYGCTRV